MRQPKTIGRPDRHEQWVGLDYVERHGLPDYPPRRIEAPRSSGGPQSLPDGDPKKEAWRAAVSAARRSTLTAEDL